MARKRRSFALAAVTTAALLAGSGIAAAQSTGGSADDDLTGTGAADTMYGYAGKDTIRGGSSADRIFGGDDNDMLFGTDEFQSGINDGTRTSVDGNDRIEGGNGNDWLVGASASDTLRGGAGADTIIEGPANDGVADTVEADPTIFSGGPPPDADTWNDNIGVASMPASKDYVNCGLGTDSVQADPLDVVNANCENVEIVDPKPSPPITLQNGQQVPALESSEGVSIAEVLNEQDPEEEQEPSPTDPQDGTAKEQFSDSFRCWAPNVFSGVNRCATTPFVGWGDLAWVGVRETIPDRWIKFGIRKHGDAHPFRYRTVHENWDPADAIWYGAGNTDHLYISARTSCWSNCYRATEITFGYYEIIRY